MPIIDANTLIATPWTVLAKQFGDKIAAAFNSLKINQSSDHGAAIAYEVNLQLNDAETTPMLQDPPGISQQTATLLQIAAPLSPTGWGLMTTGTVNGVIDVSGLGIRFLSKTITNQPQTIVITGLRLVASVESSDFTAINPDVTRVTLTPNLTVTLTGFVSTRLDINAATTVVKPDGTIQFEIDLSDVAVTAIRDFTVSGKIIAILGAQLTLNADLNLKIETVTVPYTTTFSVVLPESLVQLVQLVNQQHTFGRATTEPVQPVKDVEPLSYEASLVEQSIQNHAPNGLIYSLLFPPGPDEWTPAGGSPLNYTDEDDCAIWTGHYLAAEAFRYAAAVKKGNAQEKHQALASINVILNGIAKLFAITQTATAQVAGTSGQVTGLLSRAALPDTSGLQTTPALNAPTEPAKYYVSIQIDGQPWSALGRDADPPSRDSHMGILLGLGCAYQLVTDASVRTQVSNIFTPFLSYILANGWNVPTPTGDQITAVNGKIAVTTVTSFLMQFHQQLAMLKVGTIINPGAFSADYEASCAAADMTWIPIWGDCLDPVGKYYKFNLDHAALGLLGWLEDDATLRPHYLRAFNLLRSTTGFHRNAYFNLWQMLVDPTTENTVTNGATLKDETVYLLSQLSARFNRIQGPGSNLPRESTPSTVFILGLNKADVMIYTSAFDGESDVVVPYPLPLNFRPSTSGSEMDYVWQRQPFSAGLALGADGKPDFGEIESGDVNTEAPGIDYLLAYYMASYLSLV